jgi:hypothetical protein
MTGVDEHADSNLTDFRWEAASSRLHVARTFKAWHTAVHACSRPPRTQERLKNLSGTSTFSWSGASLSRCTYAWLHGANVIHNSFFYAEATRRDVAALTVPRTLVDRMCCQYS